MTSTHHNATCDMPDHFFAVRTSFGPLSPLEECLRKVSQIGFHGLIECDTAMCAGHLTAAGEQWLLPVIHQVLGLHQPLPVVVPDWIDLYHQARHRALQHFSNWNSQGHRQPRRPLDLAAIDRMLRNQSAANRHSSHRNALFPSLQAVA